ncbi:MAG: putative O-glycosylation ligase, exosortase A system-associated [Alphaproteobacteria bacterium]|nr:putative O-glycosylation ligase, exosortase A system-associated [Alphaproteobacteria bacterium]
MIRSAALLLVAFGLLPLALVSPFVGVLLWTWISLMSPQQWVWGFAGGIRWGLYMLAATMVGWMISADRKAIPLSANNILIVVLMVWISITTYFALVPDAAYQKWDYVFRVLVQVLISAALMTTRVRVHAMIWMLVISIGFYGVKGGLFTVLTGGRFDVQGPEATGIEDRNHLALALSITLPLIYYLRQQSEHVWVRLGLAVAFAMHVFAIVGTYSRGGLLALAAALGMIFLRSRAKLAPILLVALATPAALFFMPDRWWDRMASITAYEEDGSATGRLTIWRVCFQIGLSSIFGGGFVANQYGYIVDRFDPTVAPRAAHSIFLEVFAEQGPIGFAIWAMTLVVGFYNASWLVRAGKRKPDWGWASELGRSTQAALVAYLVGGAFLSLGYWIQVLLLLAAISAARGILAADLRQEARERQLATRIGGRRPEPGSGPAQGPVPVGLR